MSELPSSLSNWLYNVVQPQYINKQLTYTHLYQFLQIHYGKNLRLKIRTSVYTSPKSGQSTLLLNIFGSIPVIQTSLNVPVQIWIPLTYPYGNDGSDHLDDSNGVPFVYIVPDATKGIQIKPGNHVDSSGRFYHPFLSSWYHECKRNGQSSRKYNLIELTKVIQIAFEKDCPVLLHDSNSTISAPVKPSKIPINSNATDNAVTSQSTGTPLLPVSVQSTGHSATGGTIVPQSTGPPLPAKPRELQSVQEANSIPLKYQSPLPLPGSHASSGAGIVSPGFNNVSPQITGGNPAAYSSQNYSVRPQYSNQESQKPGQTDPRPQQAYPQQYQRFDSPPIGPNYDSTPNNGHNNDTTSQGVHTPVRQQFSQDVYSPRNGYPQQQQRLESTGTGNSRTESLKKSEVAPKAKHESFIDLIDEDKSTSVTPVPTAANSEISSKIQENISNQLIHEANDLTLVTSNRLKIESLYQQLSHHYKQALANSSNLESHTNYLNQQKTSISNLNRDLSTLEENNINDQQKVYTSSQTSIHLDSLITPDSALVNQLYDVVSEIKATKDTIDLIGGNFHNEGELIKDSNMETAVKTVRSLARDIFWLELMKTEIAGIMNLA